MTRQSSGSMGLSTSRSRVSTSFSETPILQRPGATYPRCRSKGSPAAISRSTSPGRIGRTRYASAHAPSPSAVRITASHPATSIGRAARMQVSSARGGPGAVCGPSAVPACTLSGL
jgi:hypothetical protein